MLATLVRDPFDRRGWVYEEKYDGIRILAYKRSTRSSIACIAAEKIFGACHSPNAALFSKKPSILQPSSSFLVASPRMDSPPTKKPSTAILKDSSPKTLHLPITKAAPRVG